MCKFGSERGSVIVLVAVMMVLLITCVALVVDIGHIHNVKIELQQAVDAAALAGAQEIDRSGSTETSIKAVAVGVGNANFVDGSAATIETSAVTLGRWDADDLTKLPKDRFTPGGVENLPNNAIRVRKTLPVSHYFFLFLSNTQVTADAIAVSRPTYPVLPLALVSCIPTGESIANAGNLPGMQICDIATYSFTNDQDDTGAWTSLTFNVSANEVGKFMDSETGKDRFNAVVYGDGLPNDGIENEVVDPGAKSYSDSYAGCNPLNFNINCGLGMIAGKKISLPDDFDPPSPASHLPVLVKDGSGQYSVPSLPSFDPMTAYAAKGALPRWYNMDEATGVQDNDHFYRVWSQDGVLLQGKSGSDVESFANYQARLMSYYNGTAKPFGDTRFASAGGGMITTYSGSIKNKILTSLNIPTSAYSSIYWPDFTRVMQHAGYPKVFVFNGTAGAILSQFLDGSTDEAGDLLCREDTTAGSPIAGNGKALILKTPVIFAGSCENWKALSQGNDQHSLVYIGMAKFLATRLWKNPNSYDCGTESDVVTVPSSCSLAPSPGPVNGPLTAVSFNTPGAMEGLIQFPIFEDEEYSSMTEVFLVE